MDLSRRDAKGRRHSDRAGEDLGPRKGVTPSPSTRRWQSEDSEGEPKRFDHRRVERLALRQPRRPNISMPDRGAVGQLSEWVNYLLKECVPTHLPHQTQKCPVPAIVPPKSFCARALNWDKLSFGEVVPVPLGLAGSPYSTIVSRPTDREPTVAAMKFRTGGNRGNGGGGSTESDLCSLLFKNPGPCRSGGAGDPFLLLKKGSPSPAGIQISSPPGIFSPAAAALRSSPAFSPSPSTPGEGGGESPFLSPLRRPAARTLNLLRTQRGDPVILPRQTAVAAPSFHARGNNFQTFAPKQAEPEAEWRHRGPASSSAATAR